MIFAEKESALVRLADSFKLGVEDCVLSTKQIVEHFRKYSNTYAEVHRIRADTIKQRLSMVKADNEIDNVMRQIPVEEGLRVARIAARLDSHALSTILCCCFCLESYINSLSYYLLEETAMLGRLGDGHVATSEVPIETIDKMSTLDKWEYIGKLRPGQQFDKSRPPFQNLRILFNYRNDVVHDKVTDINSDRPKKRYSGKLPDPATGILDLNHVVYAANTFTLLVGKVHQLTGIEKERFWRHYNISPWYDDDFEQETKTVSKEYSRIVLHQG